ncbi:MAG TPA: hypothetical protein VHT75_11490 [Acidimicrobiales bacterium]|nr:hypothetical protein [Acidimicrobiales bacterium]
MTRSTADWETPAWSNLREPGMEAEIADIGLDGPCGSPTVMD